MVLNSTSSSQKKSKVCHACSSQVSIINFYFYLANFRGSNFVCWAIIGSIVMKSDSFSNFGLAMGQHWLNDSFPLKSKQTNKQNPTINNHLPLFSQSNKQFSRLFHAFAYILYGNGPLWKNWAFFIIDAILCFIGRVLVFIMKQWFTNKNNKRKVRDYICGPCVLAGKVLSLLHDLLL